MVLIEKSGDAARNFFKKFKGAALVILGFALVFFAAEKTGFVQSRGGGLGTGIAYADAPILTGGDSGGVGGIGGDSSGAVGCGTGGCSGDCADGGGASGCGGCCGDCG